MLLEAAILGAEPALLGREMMRRVACSAAMGRNHNIRHSGMTNANS
jgi:hypothetical protein